MKINYELKPPDTIYICNGKAPCYMDSFCIYNRESVEHQEEICSHSIVPEHAKYGPCKDPENYPERFEYCDHVVHRDGADHNGYYWEFEQKSR